MIDSLFKNPQFSAKLEASLWMFVQLFAELAVLFLAISFIVGLINQKLPAEVVQRVLGDKQGRGYFTAAGIGALTPFCSCSSIPLLIGLLRARAGFGPVMTFLFTSPLLNPIVVVLFVAVLGWQITLFYAVLALTFALASGWLLNHFKFERYIKADLLGSPQAVSGGVEVPVETSCCTESKPIKNKSCGDPDPIDQGKIACCETVEETKSGCAPESTLQPHSIWRVAWDESFDLFKSMMPYMVIAMAIGAAVHGFVPTDYFTEVASADNPLAVPIAATIGVPLYVRVSTLLPLVGSFAAKGVSMGAIIALVIGSGGASIPELILLRRLFRWPLLLAFLVVIFVMAIFGGYLINALFG